MCLCSIATFLLSKSVLAKLLPVLTDRLLFVLLASTLGGSVRGVIACTVSLLLSNGSLACWPPQAWHRNSKGPCPLPGLMMNRQVGMTKIHCYRNAKRHYVMGTNDWPLLYDDFIETCSYICVLSRKSSIGNNVWVGTTCKRTFLLSQDIFPAIGGNLFCNLGIEHGIFTSIKH